MPSPSSAGNGKSSRRAVRTDVVTNRSARALLTVVAGGESETRTGGTDTNTDTDTGIGAGGVVYLHLHLLHFGGAVGDGRHV